MSTGTFCRSLIALLVAAGLLAGVGCKKQKAANPLAHVNSKQPDKVLFDRASEAMKERKYDTARLTLQTLINAYPESEFVARAKLTVGESWYQEGTTAGYAQAETEFRDFITFFPNLPEAAEAQLKIADIHYRQMGKPDRDFTHARRAQDEYRQLLQQYPDSKLAETARVRLLEVQEVLAEREYRIAKFYSVRGSLLASIARAKTLTDTYPLYSHADEAFFLLGQDYELQIERTRASALADSAKQRLIAGYLDSAAQAYSRIATRYPAMPRNAEARARLTSLNRAVPTPTPEALELNKKELASRAPGTTYERFLVDMGKRPDLSAATRVGQPNMTDPKETDAPYLAREITASLNSKPDSAGGALKVESVNGAVPENQPAPRSPVAEVKPGDVPAQAPAQLNESAPDASGEATSSSSSSTTASSAASSAASSSTQTTDLVDPKQSSSSRKQKKKFHLHIPVPF